MNKRILISTPYYLPNVSGITIYIQVLAEELVKRNFKVTILTSKHLHFLKDKEKINGVTIKRLWAPIKIGKGVIMPWFPFFSIKEILINDVLNCHLPQPESIWISFWGRIFGKKVILTHHTDLSFWKGWQNKLIDTGVFTCQYLAAKMANNLIPYTLDYATHSYFLKHFFKKINSIYPPIKFNENKINLELRNKIRNYTENKKYIIGFCGRIAKQKGLELLINSSKQLDKILGKKNYIILLAGPTKIIGEKYYDYISEKYKKEMENKFIFLGDIKRDDLTEFYKSLDVLVLPSDDTLESFGWVQIEAMLCGTPCVATNLPGMRIPIKKTEWGKLFKKNNADDLSKKITEVLIQGKKKYQNKKNKLDIFDYKKSVDKYEKLFNK